MKIPTRADVATLEALVDSISLYEVLSMLEAICVSKAAHIEESWQDRPLAKLWSNAGAEICEASSRIGERI